MASSIELLLLAQASVSDTQVLSSVTLVNSSSFSTLLTAPVAAGQGGYYMKAVIGVDALAAAGTPQIQLTTGGSGAVVSVAGYGFTGIGGAVDPGVTWKTSTGVTFNGATMAGSGTIYQMILEGFISFSAPGSLSLQVATSIAADTWNAQQGSLLRMVPLP